MRSETVSDGLCWLLLTLITYFFLNRVFEGISVTASSWRGAEWLAPIISMLPTVLVISSFVYILIGLLLKPKKKKEVEKLTQQAGSKIASKI